MATALDNTTRENWKQFVDDQKGGLRVEASSDHMIVTLIVTLYSES